MYSSIRASVCTFAIVIGSLILFNRCSSDVKSTYRKIREYSDRMSVINTHEHQHMPEEYGNYSFRFYHLLAASYLASDVSSAGADAYNWRVIDSLSLDELWDIYGTALDYTRTTTYYSQFIAGFRKLYGFTDPFFTKSNIEELSGRIEENYKNYDTWFGEAFRNAGFELMFLDQYWKPFNTEIDKEHFVLAVNINSLISESSHKPEKKNDLRSLFKIAENEGFEINNLDEYLAFCDHFIQENIEKDAICLKNSQAYSRTLYYEEVPYEVAASLFRKPSSSLTAAERKKIEDFMFHWVIQKAGSYHMPVQIHTGYLAGNGNVLDNGQPVKLNNLFLRYPGTKFVIFHGGFPWTAECAALAKMFPNVYLDLVWMPQISRQEAVNALEVMLDCVPYNKFFWGGDCGLIEESAGSLIFAKDVVAETLGNRVDRGLLTMETAFEITRRIFRENAIEVFRLKEKGIVK